MLKKLLNNAKKKSNENYKILKTSVEALSITTVCTAKNIVGIKHQILINM